jgi:flagellin-like hook-associated protein FlgL
MNQKTISEIAFKNKAIESGLETLEIEFLKETDPGTNLKNLDQAFHNVLLGMELISVLENACDEVESILSEVKQWTSPALASNLNDSQKATLAVNISLKLRELDQLAETFKHNGQNLLDGSLSVSANANTHSYLVVGANGAPENRINLNTSLNIPTINSKTLGLEILSNHSSQNGLKELMILENALGIIDRLKQRSTALNAHLKKIQKYLATAIENHRAANSSPGSYEQTMEFLQTASNSTKRIYRE